MDTTAAPTRDAHVVLPRPTPPGDDSGAGVHLLRRPVFDPSLAVAAYSLVAVASAGSTATDDELASAVSGALAELPAGVLAGGGVLFVRLPTSLLRDPSPLPPPTPALVYEVEEAALADPGAVAGVEWLAAAGHGLCLVGSAWNAALRPLLPLFRHARVDVARVGSAGLAALGARLRDTTVSVFAESVDTLGQLEACRRVGASFLSGSLMSRPPVVADRELAPSQLACLRLATALVRPEVDLTEIELAVRSDPALTMRVLKGVNSAAGARQRVSSIRQAVVLLGPRSLLGCVLAAGLAQSGATTPPEAVEAVLVRARMCEILAQTGLVGRPLDPSAAFTVGLVAGLDTLLGTDLAAVVAELPVDESVENAVLRRSGPLGAVLEDVLAYESARSSRLLPVPEVRAIFLASLSWAVPLLGMAGKP